MTRRQFGLALTGAAGLLPTTGRAELFEDAVVGSQLYGWGQYYEKAGKKAEDHLDEIFSALRDAGYDYAEGNLNTADPDANGRFADKLKKKGLKPVSLYTGGSFHLVGKALETSEKIAATGKGCAKAGFKVIVCNPDPIGRDKTDRELAIQVDALKDLASELKKNGIKLALHHHTPELRNQGHEFHYNFHNSEPGELSFCIDTHWMYRGGIAPLDALREYGNRVVTWHLRQSREKVWWEDLDTGDIDYAEIAKFARRQGLPQRYTVELALEPATRITRTVVENHARSRAFVRAQFGV
ncbi:MAG TPA: sugar phosphate isomerase/epimerase [Candidatus Limnocylindria bacterium]|nr:sugar phosphate isomerase/epimerase [Candidatus Limnocylindria bacterium]